MSIPIKNIYYLLSYAWNKLEEKDRVSVSAEDYTTLLDLLAKVLVNATRILLKRGIDRNYIDVSAEISGIKGKMEMAQTLKSMSLLRQRTICSFDEFSSNAITNRILMTTMLRLLRTKGLDNVIRGEIKNLLWRFDNVKPIDLKSSTFKSIRLHRNNKFYGFLINICRLIYESTVLSEESGEFLFADFIRDERKMNRLFEDFLRNFYKIELREHKVLREDIKWQFSAESLQSIQYLPKMQTDITLENNERKIVIDAKFYKETLRTYHGDKKIKSENLYQVFSYLINQRTDCLRSQSAIGILVYPSIDREHNLHYKFENHNIFIKTIDLNTDWRTIEKRLKRIVLDC